VILIANWIPTAWLFILFTNPHNPISGLAGGLKAPFKTRIF
jgi:hypothetical protein